MEWGEEKRREANLRGDDDEAMGGDVEEELRVEGVVEEGAMKEKEEWVSPLNGWGYDEELLWR